MCGRAACGLDPDAICNACGYMGKDGQWTKPQWKCSDVKEYQPSYNICPGSYLPVLVSKAHFPDWDSSKVAEVKEEPKSEVQDDISVTVQCSWVVQPMQWGLVPSWHSGDPKSVMYNMINARSDGILSKNTFKSPLEKGRRCVILIEGYYEWQTIDGKKQPYYIYFPPASKSTTENVNKMTEELSSGIPEGEWTGKRLLTLAGLFDVWNPTRGSDPVYSCSIITVDSHEKMQWLHHRMPAVLNGEEEVKQWLDFGSMPLSKNFVEKLIRPVNCLQWHPVSPCVNYNKNKSDECVQPIDLEKIRQKEKASSNLMKSWLTGGNRKRSAEDSKPKVEIKTEPCDIEDHTVDNDLDAKESKIPKIELKQE